MTTKADVAAALRAYADQKATKTQETRARIGSLTTELRQAYRTLEQWSDQIPGIEVEQIAASNRVEVGDQIVPLTALLIKFAGTCMTFQPEMRVGDIYLGVDLYWDEEERVFLKPSEGKFEVYGRLGKPRLGILTEELLLDEIIRLTKAQRP